MQKGQDYFGKKVVKMDGQEYDVIPHLALEATNLLIQQWNFLGRPQDPFSRAGEKIVNTIIAIWQDLYPLEYKLWADERKQYQDNEMTISEQVKQQTGRSLAAFPLPVYQMMSAVFKGFDPAERKNCIKMVATWPIFRLANRV